MTGPLPAYRCGSLQAQELQYSRACSLGAAGGWQGLAEALPLQEQSSPSFSCSSSRGTASIIVRLYLHVVRPQWLVWKQHKPNPEVSLLVYKHAFECLPKLPAPFQDMVSSQTPWSAPSIKCLFLGCLCPSHLMEMGFPCVPFPSSVLSPAA